MEKSKYQEAEQLGRGIPVDVRDEKEELAAGRFVLRRRGEPKCRRRAECVWLDGLMAGWLEGKRADQEGRVLEEWRRKGKQVWVWGWGWAGVGVDGMWMCTCTYLRYLPR